jgi:Protein of unknown function (DUF2889)
MPLPPPVARQLVTSRTVTCHGYVREDGLLDIEGRLVDTRGHETHTARGGAVAVGVPVHDMWVRLTIDAELIIRAAVSATDASPYLRCTEITPNMSRLVGLKISGGFKREMHARIGNTQGCTHIVALIEALATVAVQTSVAKQRDAHPDQRFSVFGSRGERSRPPLIDSCHTYSADGPIAQVLWPAYYRPPK